MALFSTVRLFLEDAGFAVRTFRRSWVFSLTAIATLAIGIGANTAVFSVLNAVLLEPLGIPDPDRVVILGWLGPEGLTPGSSALTFNHWSAETDSFQELGAFRPARLNYLGGEAPGQIMTAEVSDGFFRCFGLPIAEGRALLPEDMLPGAPRVAVISQRMRERSFPPGADVLGERIELGGVSYEVIGVAGVGFDPGQLREFNVSPQAYLPLEIAPNSTDQTNAFVNEFRVAARLRDGVTVDQVRDRLDRSALAYLESFPGAMPEQFRFGAEPFADYAIGGGTRRTLWILAGAVLFVLLIACANTASLFMVRAGSRGREMAVRAAVGAGRARLIRQLLTESVLLFLVAGGVGLGLGLAGIRALLAARSSGLPRLGEGGALVVLDWRVLTFALLASLITGIVFGLMPAIAASRFDVSTSLKDAGRGGGAGPGRARGLLVAAEVALTVMLLTGAGLLIRTQTAILAVDAGYDARNTLVMRTTLDDGTGDPTPRIQRTLDELRELPGVEGATLTCGPCLPLQIGLTMPWYLEDFPPRGGGPRSRWVAAADEYFQVFGIRVLAGRVFDSDDRAGTPPVVVINQKMRETFFSDNDPIGRRLIIGQENRPREIIGIVDDIPDGDLRRPVAPRMYVPIAQLEEGARSTLLASNNFALRTRGNPYRSSQAAGEVVFRTMGVPVSGVESGEDLMRRSLGSLRFNLLLMSVFAAAAVLLASVGVFGMVAYTVDRRRHEIGIRLALGADAGRVRRRVLGEGLVLALGGTGAGMLASWWLVEILASQLFEVQPRDPMVFSLVPALVLLLALLASWVPADRASRIEPLRALRYE